jgi:high-affinity iron transporter
VTAAYFLLLREGLEAALIVGIVGAYLVKVGRRDGLRSVWIGVGLAFGLSIAVGAIVAATVGSLPVSVQETIEGLAALFAVAVLTWMLFWMRRQGRAMKGDLEHGVDLALRQGTVTALAGLAFAAVAREGLETVLFLFALGAQTADLVTSTLIGAAAGLATAIAIGYAIFRLGVRIDLRRFFTFTGVILIFVSAGLVAFAIHAFGEAGLIVNQGAVYDLGGILPATSPLGSVLAGLFGYRAAPTPLEVIGYFAYLVPVLLLFVFSGRTAKTAPKPSSPPAAAAG